jgi:hypothetical protein
MMRVYAKSALHPKGGRVKFFGEIMASSQEMPIFVRTFDLLTWLLPITNNFPRAHRHTATKRLLDAAFDLREHLEAANHRMGVERMAFLRLADEDLDNLRLYIRLAARWEWLSAGQYQHVAKMVAEIGRLLGGWINITHS